jgi:23S rRNA (guanosine2251-2'-O)-methyltransferase
VEKEQMIYGIRPVMEAILAGKEIDKVLIQNALRSELFIEFKKLLAQHQVPYQYVPVEKLNRVTQKNHQGVIAYVSNISYSNIEQLIPFLFDQGKAPLIVVLDRLTDVRNFGAIARTAVCTGVDGLIIPEQNSVRVSADAVKSSAGALHQIAVCKSQSLLKTLEYLKSCGLQIVSCTEKASKLFFDIDFSVPTALVFGSEEDGITDKIIKNSDQVCKIPMTDAIGSMNVSVATGIVLFEAYKQRL